MKIKKLTENLINKIAAGEVVERPAYALKELIENSIDANAKNIVVDLKNWGLDEIKVTDDGDGMDKEDLILSVQSHTTSKITDESDLEKISTLGFRGEALASIKSISRFEIKSRQKDKKGYSLTEKKLQPVAMKEGTQVIIKNIFSPTPARKSFLKSPLTEFRHILDQINSFALSYPNIGFKLTNDNKVFINSPKETLENRISAISGTQIKKLIFKLSSSQNYIRLEGYISHPQINFKTKNKMYIFVNGRRVFNTALTNALIFGYRNLLMHGSYPYTCIFLHIQKDLVDVNVHPRKEYLKFINEELVVNFLKETVAETLDKNNLTFNNLSFKERLTNSSIAKNLKIEIQNSEEAKLGKIKHKSGYLQVLNTYIITETENGILLLDQHAVHEAILFSKYKKAYLERKSKNLFVKIAKPIVVNLSNEKTALLKDNISYFNSVGFCIEEFGQNAFKLSSVPLVATDIAPEKILNEALEDLENNSQEEISKDIYSMLSFLSCRSAIKAGQKLTKYEIKNLIKYLREVDLAYTCPHGRPVKIELSKSYLEKIFKRTI